MAAHLDIALALDSIADKKKAVQKSFSDLESQRRTLLKRPYDWKELNDHFVDVENALRKKYEEFLQEQKTFEASKKPLRDAVEKQGKAIAAAEQTSLTRVQQQKDAAVKVILDSKRKWNSERQKLELQIASLPVHKPTKHNANNDSKEPAEQDDKDSKELGEDHSKSLEKQAEQQDANALEKPAEQQNLNASMKLPEHDANSSKKSAEQGTTASKKRKKQKKIAKATDTKTEDAVKKLSEDASTQVIETLTKIEDTQTAVMDGETGDTLKEDGKSVNISVKDDETEMDGVLEEPAVSTYANDVDTDSDSCSGVKDGANQEKEPVRCSEAEMEQLKTLCKNMNGLGLKAFLVSNRRLLFSAVIAEELSVALKCAADPGGLVLKALQGYNKLIGEGKKGNNIYLANQRAIFYLLEAFKELCADPSFGQSTSLVSSKLKEEAKAMADNWKSRKIATDGKASKVIEDGRKSRQGVSDERSHSLYAESFLQLLATFGLASEYDQDYLCKLVCASSRRAHLVSLFESLGLTKRMPEVIEMLLKNDRIIEALSLAESCSLLNRFQPAPLLKTYLKEARKAAREMLKEVNDSLELQMAANHKELAALKVVVKAIARFDLELQFPSSNLQKRITELQADLERRRAAAGTANVSSKKRQAEKSGSSSVKRLQTDSNLVIQSTMAPPTSLPRYPLSDRPSLGVAGLPPFVPGMRPGVAFSGGVRNPLPLFRPSLYSSGVVGSTLYGSSGLANPLPLYPSYQHGHGTRPPIYQGPYLR